MEHCCGTLPKACAGRYARPAPLVSIQDNYHKQMFAKHALAKEASAGRGRVASAALDGMLWGAGRVVDTVTHMESSLEAEVDVADNACCHKPTLREADHAHGAGPDE